MRITSKPKIDLYSLGLMAIAVACSMPFLNHAFHIYEPLFLAAGEHLAYHPGRPYDFKYLWGSNPQPMWQILNFPPLFAYYLAALRRISGPLEEFSTHLALIPFSALAVLAFFGICKQNSLSPRRSFLAAACLAACPAFMVSANLATPDMAALGLGLSSWYLAIRGWKNNRTGLLGFAGLLLGMACLSRYSLVWLILVFPLLGSNYRSGLRALIPSAISLCMFSAWVVAFRALYGSNYALEVLGLVLRPADILRNLWTTPIHLCLAGGFPFLVTAYILRKSPFWFLSGLLLTIYLSISFYYSKAVPYFGFLPDALFFGIGLVTLLALAVLASRQAISRFHWSLSRENIAEGFRLVFDLRKNSGAAQDGFQDLFLILWFFLALFFPSYSNLYPNKFLLLGIPPLLLLTFKYLPRFHDKGEIHAMVFLPCYFLLSFFVARADFDLADSYRREATAAAHSFLKEDDNNVWFLGHWGWQYYMERDGFLALDAEKIATTREIYPGDIVISASYNSPQLLPMEWSHSISILERHSVESSLPLRTMNTQARAGLHSDLWGPLPFSFSRVPLERFSYYLFQSF